MYDACILAEAVVDVSDTLGTVLMLTLPELSKYLTPPHGVSGKSVIAETVLVPHGGAESSYQVWACPFFSCTVVGDMLPPTALKVTVPGHMTN